MLQNFHPATRRWFEEYLGKPTDAQVHAWKAIKEGKHTLVAAPTGSGKTLAAFYAAIDDLVVRKINDDLPHSTQIVYVSPLKALSNDIHRNLEVPLNGIREELKRQGIPPFELTVAVRTGDTSQEERRQMLKNPPHILVTTPESLYLLMTSVSGRKMLGDTRVIIIDEIHALIADKRGSHLSLTVERLESLVGRPLVRIGLSATQKPVELVASFLVGSRNIKDGVPHCAIVDTGHRRKLDISLEVPRSPLTAVMSNEVWGELYERLVELIGQHKTTLIFVNTRRLAERLAMGLGERIGEQHVSSHHGSMSKEHRHKAEQRLKAGELKVLVATASMELGIDIGSVDLVVQFASPSSIAAFLQRVGRSGHFIGGTPKGIFFPLTRDELVEGAALLHSVRLGELDHIVMPEKPLDILSQQIIAEVASQEWAVQDLYQVFVRAYPFRDLSLKEFTDVVHNAAEGFTTRRGRRGAYVYYDAVHGRMKGRPGARLAALTNGGAIPDTFDYEVVLQPEGITVGTLNEEFALESLSGDIFVLGTHTWQLVKVEGLKVIVHDATGKAPTVPFWQGEGPGRTMELSQSVSRLRVTIGELLDKTPVKKSADGKDLFLNDHPATQWLITETGVSAPAAEQLVLYLYMGKTGLGVMPSLETIVLERFFDEAGDMHLVVHSPYGSLINRAWGLALRKKFCRNFNFELQAAATENSIILSLSSSHSFPLDEVFRYLNTKIVRDTLIQAMLDAPLFEVRWRWNATRSLAILRNRAGQRVPPYLQRMQAEDLIAQVFPDQIACLENIQGDREIPDHPLVNQAIHDCLTEAMDIEGLTELIGKIERKEINLIAKDLREPSAFAQEIINARPYAFLDDTEFAERRVNAIRNRSWLDPQEAEDLSQLDPQAIERVREEAWPEAATTDEMHDVLLIHGFILQAEADTCGWTKLLKDLSSDGRCVFLKQPGMWFALERYDLFKSVFKHVPDMDLPAHLARKVCDSQEALREILRGRMEALGPVTVKTLAQTSGLSETDIETALIGLEVEGFVFRGHFTPGLDEQEWCERRLLQRIHRYTIDTLRQSIQPVPVQDFMRFLFERHKMRAEDEQTGPDSLLYVLEQMEGYEAPAGSWELDIIPARMANYDPSWLDTLCMSGRIVWGRFNPPKSAALRKKSGPIKSTPIVFVPRSLEHLWRKLKMPSNNPPVLSTAARKVEGHLRRKGASFFDDIVESTGLLKSQVEAGMAELVSQGLVVSDAYAGLRALLTPQANKPPAVPANRRDLRRKAAFGIEHAGRWSLLPDLSETEDEEVDYETLEYIIMVYMRRWGVLFRGLLDKESFAPPWRIVVRVLRRMELRGEVRGGRFIAQVSGEQYALEDTVDALRRVHKEPKTGELISISAVDPFNLLGGILPGSKVPNITSNRILFKDGVPVAVYTKKNTAFLSDFPEQDRWDMEKTLTRRKFPTKLRYYLGKNYT